MVLVSNKAGFLQERWSNSLSIGKSIELPKVDDLTDRLSAGRFPTEPALRNAPNERSSASFESRVLA